MEKRELSPEQSKGLLRILKARFEQNRSPTKAGLEWAAIQAKLEANAEKLWYPRSRRGCRWRCWREIPSRVSIMRVLPALFNRWFRSLINRFQIIQQLS